MDLGQYRYKKGTDGRADDDFRQSSGYGRVRLGSAFIFWKKGLRWYRVPLGEVTRAFRRIEAVDTKMCCGNVNFDIQKLVLKLRDGGQLELRIGDGMPREAELLFERLKTQEPAILFGKA